jgi:hypothetical protein
MGGSITVGVLSLSGYVYYYTVDDISEHEIFEMKIEKHRQMCKDVCASEELYFDYKLFEEEDSSIRYLMISQNEIVYRLYGGDSEYTLTKKKLK